MRVITEGTNAVELADAEGLKSVFLSSVWRNRGSGLIQTGLVGFGKVA
jgi:hypothetical protein